MTRLRVTGRGVAYAASALLHGGVVWALLPSLTGSAAPTPAETPMAIEMAGFGGPAETLDTAEPVETAQPDQIAPAEATPVETAQAEPVQDQPVQDQPVETVVEQPPPPAETPVTEVAEVEPPEPAPEAPPPELVTTTGQTEAVVAAVPETVQAVEPEAVQAAEPEVVQPPPTKPKPRAERRPRREQPRRTEQPASPAPTEQAALPAKPATPSPPANAGGQRVPDYLSMLNGYLGRRIKSVGAQTRTSVWATVAITIELDGSFSSVEMTQSSGSASIDRDILRQVRRASPASPPPQRISHPFQFRIDP